MFRPGTPPIVPPMVSCFTRDIGFVDEGIAVLKLNVEFHPRSPTAWSSLAEGYARSGNDEMAIVNLRKAVELAPDDEGLKGFLRWLESKQESAR